MTVSPKHLPLYLAEFCYRHNRRFQLDDLLPPFAYVAVRTPPMPGRLLKLAEAYGVIRKKFTNSTLLAGLWVFLSMLEIMEACSQEELDSLKATALQLLGEVV